MLLGILALVVVGLIVGFAARQLVNLHGDDPRLGLALSVVAAVFGGVLYTWISGSTMQLANMWSLLYAGIAAALAITAWHIVRGRGTHKPASFRRSY